MYLQYVFPQKLILLIVLILFGPTTWDSLKKLFYIIYIEETANAYCLYRQSTYFILTKGAQKKTLKCANITLQGRGYEIFSLNLEGHI